MQDRQKSNDIIDSNRWQTISTANNNNPRKQQLVRAELTFPDQMFLVSWIDKGDEMAVATGR